MKKLFAKILSLTLAVVMSAFLFNGCGLVTKNEERDMAQIIATVSLDPALKTDIKKKELKAQFNSQGAYYVNYMGYTEQEAYETLLDELVKTEILTQQSILALTGKTGVLGNEEGLLKQASLVPENERTNKEKVLTTKNHDDKDMATLTKESPLDQFLTEYEYNVARFQVVYAIRSLLDTYIDEEEEEHNHSYENYAGTARATLTAPTEVEGNEYEIKEVEKYSVVDPELEMFKSYNALNRDYELGLDLSTYQTKYDLMMAVYEKFIEKFEITEREDKKAVTKLIKDLKKYGFISAQEAAGKVPTTAEEFLNISYFKDNLEVQYSTLIVAKYELALTNQQEKLIDKDDELYNAYLSIFNSQKAIYQHDYTAYEAAIEGATELSQVLYNPNFGGKYGQVLNLLIGFNDAQNDIIAKAEENTNLDAAQKKAVRDEVLKTLIVEDLRTSWVDAGYGVYDSANGVVTFKDQYCKTADLSKFMGSVYGASEYIEHDAYNNEITKHHFDAVKANQMSFEEFFNGKTGGFAGVAGIMGFNKYTTVIDGFGGKLQGVEETNALGTVLKEETLEKYRDLIYAFSTDSGSLSEGYGYFYSPKTSATKYVKEYADASKELINEGVGAYRIVATEDGYHVMLCTRVIEPSEEPITKQNFTSQLSEEGSIPYNFKEYQKQRVVYDNINKITSAFINANNKEPQVTLYKDAYKDLVEVKE